MIKYFNESSSGEDSMSFSELFNLVFNEKRRIFLDKVARQTRRPRHELLLSDYRAAEAKVKIGDTLVAQLRKTLDMFGLTRSKMQVSFHEAFLSSCSQDLYKMDKDTDFVAVHARQGWENFKQSTLCLTPRRMGKTTAIAMFVSAYLFCVPETTIAIFSTGRRASLKLLQQVRSMLLKLPDAEQRVGNIKNKEDLTVLGNNKHDTRRVSSFPGNATALRGVGGSLVILEEAAFISSAVFYEICVPLLELGNTSLLAISTPLDDTNFFSELFDLKDQHGEPFFNTIRILSLIHI